MDQRRQVVREGLLQQVGFFRVDEGMRSAAVDALPRVPSPLTFVLWVTAYSSAGTFCSLQTRVINSTAEPTVSTASAASSSISILNSTS